VKNVVQALKAQQAMHVIAFLKEWNVAWTTQSRLVHGMQSMFMYLDRFYVPNNEQLPLYKKGYTICKELILEEFKKFVVDAILSCVAKERAGETQDRDLLAKAIRAFVDLGYHLELGVTLYQENFEVAFIQQTKLFYKQQAQIWLEQDSCPDYLKKAEAAIDDEENRLNMYLHSSSLNVLMSTCRDELLKFHQPELLAKQTGIYDMLSRNAVDDLSRIYKLYQHVEEGIKPIAEALKEHVKKLGSGLIEQSKNKAKSKDASASDKGGVEQHEFIESLIELHETYRNIVKNCFTKDQVFEKALKEAFEDFINKEFYTSNLLAKFINDVLTKDSKVHAQDIENTLDHVVMLYGYIRQKDVFEERYHTYLANRLLTRKSESEHSEKNMISKLKNEAGYQWTSKLETMFKDVVKSQELMEEFSRSHKVFFVIQNVFANSFII
jgi:cullin 1